MELCGFLFSVVVFPPKLNLISILCRHSARLVGNFIWWLILISPLTFPCISGVPSFCEAKGLGTRVRAGTRVRGRLVSICDAPYGAMAVLFLQPVSGVLWLLPSHSQGLAAGCLSRIPATAFSFLQLEPLWAQAWGHPCHPHAGTLPLPLDGGAFINRNSSCLPRPLKI